jgi:chromosome segregation ATPase
MRNDRSSSTSPTATQESTSLVNIERADSILSIGEKCSNTRTIIIELKNLADDIKARQKKNTVLYETITLIQPMYTSKMRLMEQNMRNIKANAKHIAQVEITHLQQKSKSLEKKVPVYESNLTNSREYAEQRRDKKAKRESQYHRLYYVPILSQEFKKKYIRARDKHSIAEEKLCETREVIDNCQKDMSATAKSITEANTKVKDLSGDYNTIKEKLLASDQTLVDLHEQHAYWKSFDNNQSILALKAIEGVVSILENHKSKLSAALDINQDYIKTFRMRCYEYGQAEQQGNNRWKQRSIDFTCSKCKVDQKGWPIPDKVYSSSLLCSQCYTETRTSMIVEKKVNKLINSKFKTDSSQKPRSASPCKKESASFAKPLPNNPGFKKMFTMIKGN